MLILGMEDNRRIVEDLDNINIDIRVIGYKTEGESILFFVKDSNVVIYSILIDCFEFKSLNKTKEILNSLNVSSLDLICWTHPDEDHTIGLEDILSNYSDAHTIFIAPSEIEHRVNGCCQAAQNLGKWIHTIHSGKRVNQNHYSALVNRFGDQSVATQEFCDSFGRNLTLIIKAVAPISTLLNHYDSKGSKNSNNYLSIALHVNIGEKKFLFAGDIENPTIKEMNKQVLHDLSFLKAPHHTSESTCLLYKYLEQECCIIPVSVTTIFERYKLPDTKLIKDYSKTFENFYSTGYPSENKDRNLEDFGIVQYECSYKDQSSVSGTINNVHLFGNAIKLK